MTSPAAARQNRYGNRIYPIPKPGTLEMVELSSVTALLSVIAKPGLEVWKRWRLAQALSLRPDWVALAGSGEMDAKGTISGAKDVVKQVDEANNSSSNTGTSIHFFTEQVDDDCLMWEMVPEPIKDAVAKYAQAKEDYGWEMVRKEFSVYNFTDRYAGTADRILRLPKFSDKTHICDVKAGKDVYADYAIQLGAYAFSEGIWVAPDSTPVSDAAMLQLTKDINAGVNIPPTHTGKKRSTWNQAAIKAAEAEIQEQHWEEYARLGRHETLPEDLCQEVAYILHVTNDHFELVPLAIAGLQPAVAGIAAMHDFLNNKNIVGEPLSPFPEVGAATPAQVAPPADDEPPVAVDEPAPDELPTPPEPQAQQDVSGQSLVPDQALPGEQSVGAAAQEPETLSPNTGPIPVADNPPPAVRVTVYRDRIQGMSGPARQRLASRWPKDIPTFKQTDQHTDEQLAVIDRLLWDIETEFPPSVVETQNALDKLVQAFTA